VGEYIHTETPDSLIRLAVLHAEFEAIHPFLDGNGRLGRLLIPLYLVHAALLASPDFYMSAYLETHRDEYYERLLAVSRDGDWTGWCVFFLTAIIEQAKSNYAKAKGILDLYQEIKDWFLAAASSQYSIQALDWFFKRPIFRTSDFVSQAPIPKPTAARLVRLARDEGLLVETRPASGRRPAILAFSKLLDIADRQDAL
jgi:Fic family protein